MPYLGVDQSLSATGLCLVGVDGNVVQLATVDPGNLVGGKRLVVVKNALVKMCRSVDWKVAGAAMEGYSIGSINRPFDLGEVGGIIKMVLAENDIPHVIVAPAILKMFATGTPGATKERMEEAAKALGAAPDNDNEADAFFLARTARAYHSQVEMTRREMDAIHALKNPPKRAVKKKPRKLIPAAI